MRKPNFNGSISKLTKPTCDKPNTKCHQLLGYDISNYEDKSCKIYGRVKDGKIIIEHIEWY